MPWTAYLANKYLDQAFRNVAYARSTNLHFALFTATPNGAGGGTEVSGGSYSRIAVTATTAANNFNVIGGGSSPAAPGEHLYNANAITWARPTSSWGTVVAYGIYDASSGGNLLMYETLPAPITIDAFNRPFFAARALEFAIGGACGALLEAQILNHLFRGVTWAALSVRGMLGTAAGSATTFPNELPPSTTGTSTPSPTTAYSRPSIVAGAWGAAAGGSLTNSGSAINFVFGSTFAGATATHFGLIHDPTSTFNDTPAAANMIWHGALSSSLVVPANAGSTSTYSWAQSDAVIGFEL